MTPPDLPTPPTLTTLLDEIDARAKAATEGPWFVAVPYGQDDDALSIFAGLRDVTPSHARYMGDDSPESWTQIGRDDAAFIASARTDVPRLVAALRYALTHIATERDCVIANCSHSGATKHRDALCAILSGQERAS